MRVTNAERFIGFDILKFACAFLIVCIHVPFPGIIGEYFTALTRIAVPIFFMITGFYYCDVKNRRRELQQIKKIFVLFLVANLLFVLWKSLWAVLSGEGLFAYWSGILTLKNVARFLLLNDSPFNGHLWYLGAILYVLVIFYILQHSGLHIKKGIGGGGGILVLLLIDLLLGKYSLLLFSHEFPYILVRNFLCVGLPYFSIGMMLRQRVNKKHYDKNKLVLLVIIFSITTLWERFMLVGLDANATRDHYISTTFLAITVFLLFWMVYQNREVGAVERTMAMIGRKYSTEVYIVHPILTTVFAVVARRLGVFTLYSTIAPFAVFICSIIGVAVWHRVLEQIRK